MVYILQTKLLAGKPSWIQWALVPIWAALILEYFVWLPRLLLHHRVAVRGTLPNDALLLNLFPHMHLRGKTFEYRLREGNGRWQTLLSIPHYDFYWQLSYRLATPLVVKAGATLEAIATFDNSRNNPHNPDPDSAVTWGEQTWAEMMVGFFDVAVDPSVDKAQFFIRTGKGSLH